MLNRVRVAVSAYVLLFDSSLRINNVVTEIFVTLLRVFAFVRTHSYFIVEILSIILYIYICVLTI